MAQKTAAPTNRRKKAKPEEAPRRDGRARFVDHALDRLRAKPGERPNLSQGFDPDLGEGPRDKKEGRAWLAEEAERLKALQEVFYADARRAVLVVFQAMDTGGKDGTIRGVFGPLNPQGVRVSSFKQPTPIEQARDYLWRVHAAVPAKGMIAVFNRSHYEDVLVARVHGLAPEEEIERRYRQINDFERHLAENGVAIRKFMLHIGKDEQRERLQARLDDPDKHWKFAPGDLAERQRWDDYMDAYARAIKRCSADHAPWYVIPANRKWWRNWAVARILRRTLEDLKPRFPPVKFDAAAIRID